MADFPQGLIQIYTGEGKGKTTAALGLAVRALGHDLRVYIIQFMKGQGVFGERETLKRLLPECQIEGFGAPGWVHKGQDLAAHSQEGRRALMRAKEIVYSGAWQIVILDEIINAIWFELISEEEVLDLLNHKPAEVELVLTGRNASALLMDKADLVTEMVAKKHPFERGMGARAGIEY